MVDSDNVEIRYSLQPMTSLWRHISYLTHVNKNITLLLMNWNVITYSQNIRLFL